MLLYKILYNIHQIPNSKTLMSMVGTGSIVDPTNVATKHFTQSSYAKRLQHFKWRQVPVPINLHCWSEVSNIIQEAPCKSTYLSGMGSSFHGLPSYRHGSLLDAESSLVYLHTRVSRLKKSLVLLR